MSVDKLNTICSCNVNNVEIVYCCYTLLGCMIFTQQKFSSKIFWEGDLPHFKTVYIFLPLQGDNN